MRVEVKLANGADMRLDLVRAPHAGCSRAQRARTDHRGRQGADSSMRACLLRWAATSWVCWSRRELI